jgi:hypothetical protein
MHETFAASIETIAWFGSCEEPRKGELSIPSAAIPTSEQAGNALDDPAWGN